MPYKDPEKAKECRRRWQKKNYWRFAAKKAARDRKNKRYWTRNWKLKGISITVAQRTALFEEQKGRCAICGRHESEFKKALAVDHDHVTGRIRGLLCLDCNSRVLVVVEKYSHLIERATEYIRDERNYSSEKSRTVGISSL